MSYVLFALALAFCGPALAANSAEGGKAVKKTSMERALATRAGAWCRAADGRLIWMTRPADGAKTATINPQPPPANGATRTDTNYRPNSVTTYPDSARPETVNGVNWYLNGRSYFSD